MPDRSNLDPHDLEDFTQLDGLLRGMAPTAAIPAGLRERTLRAVIDAPAPGARPERPARRRWRFVLAGAAGAAAIAVVALLLVLGGTTRPEPELRATLKGSGLLAISGRAEVVKTGIGREIEFRTDELPILPTGEYYELWFVARGDSPGNPKRISAGTFHPDPQGRSHARFTAAADPRQYPELSVTAEPGDGDPRPSTTEVLRSATSLP